MKNFQRIDLTDLREDEDKTQISHNIYK